MGHTIERHPINGMYSVHIDGTFPRADTVAGIREWIRETVAGYARRNRITTRINARMARQSVSDGTGRHPCNRANIGTQPC